MEALIRIEEYKIHCVIGDHAYEREDEQEISVDIDMRVNIQECAQTDSIVDTINYSEVVKLCKELAKIRRYHLLETFAFEMIHALMTTFSPLGIRVRVRKKKSIPLAKSASVEL